MPTLTFRTPIDAPPEALFAWHARPGAFQRLVPPWAPVRLARFEGIEDGDRAVIRLGPDPVSLRWIAEHTGYEAGRQFCDRQVEGPFKRWLHTHRMEPAPDGGAGSILVDHLDFELPAQGLLGGRLASLEQLGLRFVERELRRQFAYRHRVTRRDVALHRAVNPGGRRLRIAVTGASGLIGSALVPLLTTGGHEVVRVVRKRPVRRGQILWNPRAGAVEAEKFEGLDAVIHLAGENVFALRWTPEKKRRIMASRDAGTRLLAEALAGLDDPPGVFLSASAVGFYGDHGTEIVTENTAPRDAGFLGAVTRAWEAATRPAADAGIRTATLRIGVVLSPRGGALKLMLPAFRLGLGGRVGAADQYVPWIVRDDVAGAFLHALFDDALSGPVNVTAPTPVPMQAFTDTLARVLRRPAALTVPNAAVRTVMGEAADEVLLKSARVVPQRLTDAGYAFGWPDLEAALRHVLGKTLQPHRAWS